MTQTPTSKPRGESSTPRTNHLFDEELGRLVASDPHYHYFKRVREEMTKLEHDLERVRAQTIEFGLRCRPAVKQWETRCAMSVLKWERGEYPPHYEKILKDEAERARKLFDDIEALTGLKAVEEDK